MPSSLSRADRTGGEIDWPAWAERTEPEDRERTSKFSVTLAIAIIDIRDELEDRLGADDWRISTAAPHRKDDGLPYSDANPDDPGAVIRWTMDGEQYGAVADEYTRLRDNVRALGLWLEEKRMMAERPVSTAQSEFATAALPSGEDDEAIAVGSGSVRSLDPVEAREMLGVRDDADEDTIIGAYRRKVKVAHPDNGGDEDVAKLKRAKNVALADLDYD